jgi:predicted nucleic acid-binding protein
VKRFILDAWALLAWLGGEEPAAGEVQALLDSAAQGAVELSMSLVNFGEVYYGVARKEGLPRAREIRRLLRQAPIRFAAVDDELVWEAAELKAAHLISYAAAFAAALSIRLDAPLVTGDPDFDALRNAGRIAVKRLSRKARGRA